jgi:hypothetical protein
MPFIDRISGVVDLARVWAGRVLVFLGRKRLMALAAERQAVVGIIEPHRVAFMPANMVHIQFA